MERPLALAWTEGRRYLASLSVAVTVVANLHVVAAAGSAALTPLAEPQVRIRLAATDTAGNPIDSTPIASDFQIRGYLRDLRENGQGVFAAYMDIEYDPALSSVKGAISSSTFDPLYRTFFDGNASAAGLVNELGSAVTDFFTPLGTAERLQFVLPFHAVKAGIAAFALDQPDTEGYDVLLFQSDMPVPWEEVEALHASLKIVDFVAGDTAPFDGVVNVSDLNNVRNHFGDTGDPSPFGVPGDVYPFDGRVDEHDLNAVRNYFGASRITPVPEPASQLLLAVGATVLMLVQGQRKKASL